MQKSDKKPSTWLASLPDAERAQLKRLDKLITNVMKGHTRTLWEGKFWGGSEQTILAYGDYNFTGARNKVVPWFMVGLALQKNYISVYVHAVDGGEYVAEKYAKRLGKVKAGKSSISFRHVDDIELDVLTEVLTLARRQLDTRDV